MGRRGPKPLPGTILAFRGSPRANRRADESVVAESGIPTMPEWLNDRGKATWHDLAPKLCAMGVLTTADGLAFARYCDLWARWTDATRFIDEHGMTATITRRTGRVDHVAYPQVRIASRLSDELLKLEREFGLTPSARVGLRVNPPSNADNGKKAAYFNRGATNNGTDQ
ncbi:MAG: phage terminase small subunit P27 family [Phycisphaerales bacterium]|nr:phage terminase small subunit P27 family [Phycisphaerales bacterium]